MFKMIYGYKEEPKIISPCTTTINVSDNLIGVGDSIIYTGSVTGTAPKTYNWTFTGGNISSSTSNPVTVTYDTKGLYTASLITTNGEGSTCNRSATVTVDCVAPPVDSAAAIWLNGYDSTDEDAAIARDATGTYPYGPNMPLSYYADTRVTDLYNNYGLTLIGPNFSWNNYKDLVTGEERVPPTYVAEMKRLGVRCYHRLYEHQIEATITCNNVTETRRLSGLSGVCYRWDNGFRNELQDLIDRHIETVLRDPDYDEVVSMWYFTPEDFYPHPGRCPPETYTSLFAYMDMVASRIALLDPKKRPLHLSSRGDTTPAGMVNIAQHGPSVEHQSYMVANCLNHTGVSASINGLTQEDRWQVGQWAKEIVASADNAKNNPTAANSYTGRPLVAIQTLGSYQDPININTDWITRILTHDYWVSMVMGISGLDIYTDNASNSTASIQKGIYLDLMRKTIDNNLHRALVWGEEKTDITLSGNSTFTWYKYGTAYSAEPSVKMRNILYRGKRYVLVVNAYKTPISITLGNLPSEYLRYIDIDTSITTELISSTLPITLGGLDHKLFIFELADCGGGGGGGGGDIIQDVNGCVSFDATNYTTNVAGDVHSWDAVSGTALQALPDSGATFTTAPIVSYDIEFVQTGTHYIWVRGKSIATAPGTSDSLFMNLNSAAWQDMSSFPSASLGWSGNQFSTGGGGRATINVTSTGVHTFNIKMREDGFTFDSVQIHPTVTTNPGECGDIIDTGFLANYTNPDREALPTEKLHPIGQKMVISMWATYGNGEVLAQKNAGFTTLGPNHGWGTDPNDQRNIDLYTYAGSSDIGFRSIASIHPSSAYNGVRNLCEVSGNTSEVDNFVNIRINAANQYMANPTFNNIIDAWNTYPEEYGYTLWAAGTQCPGSWRCDDSGVAACVNNVTDTKAALKRAMNELNAADSQHRPQFTNDTANANETTWKYNEDTLENFSTQIYDTTGIGVSWGPLAYMQGNVRGAMAAYAAYPNNDRRQNVVIPIFGIISTPPAGTSNTAAWWRNYASWAIYMSMSLNAHGFQVYGLNVANSKPEGYQGFLSAVSEFTTHGFDQAFLWGKRMTGETYGLSITQDSGNTNIGYADSTAFLYSDIQFGNHRYIALTNSDWQGSITVSISGLPVGYKIRNCKTNVVSTITNSVKSPITIESEGYRIYKIELGDGGGGGGGGGDTPTISTIENVTVAYPGPFCFNAVVTDAISMQWQWRRYTSGAWGSWAPWVGKTAQQACGTFDVEAMKGQEYRLQATNGTITTTSNTATLNEIDEPNPTKPTISTIADVTVPYPSAFCFNATVSNATSMQWYYRNAGITAWSSWPGRTSEEGCGTYDVPQMEGRQLKLVASNGAGSTTSNIATLRKTVTGGPTISTVANVYTYLDRSFSFSANVSGATGMQWKVKPKSTGIWIDWPGRTSATGAGYIESWNSAMIGNQYQLKAWDSNGNTSYSNVATLYLKS